MMDDLDNKTSKEPVMTIEEDDQEGYRDQARNNGSWVFALVLIGLGVFFLAQVIYPTLFENFENWWALFFLIPAVASFGSAWNKFHRRDNQFTSGVMGSVIGGSILSLLTVFFLVNRQEYWKYFWPIVLILIGFLLFIKSFLKKD